MRWWDERVVPRVVDLTCSGPLADGWRARTCGPVVGQVLELGFGSGRNLEHYGEGVTRVLAVEPSDLAWEMSADRRAAFGRPVERIGLDGASIDIPDDSVDAVVSTWTLCTIPDLGSALAETARVLRPGGALHLVEHSLSPSPRMARAQRRMQPLWGRVAGGCHLDRNIPAELTAAGFDLPDLRARDAAGLPTPWSWFVTVQAVPCSCLRRAPTRGPGPDVCSVVPVTHPLRGSSLAPQDRAFADRTFAAVLFDNDGTLVDSSGPVVRSWVQWAREHDVDPYALQGFHGVPAAGIIAAVAPHLDPEAALARIDEIEVSDVDGVVALPGALAALDALPDTHKAIVTSAGRPLAEARLAAAGLTAPPDTVTIEDVERGKPSPDPFVLAAQRLGADPADCLVVEDAPSGIEAAQAAGCAVVAVTTNHTPDELPADLVVGSLADLTFTVVDGRVRVAPAASVGG